MYAWGHWEFEDCYLKILITINFLDVINSIVSFEKNNPFVLEIHTQIISGYNNMLSSICIRIIQAQQVRGHLDKIIVAAEKRIHRGSLHCQLLYMS